MSLGLKELSSKFEGRNVGGGLQLSEAQKDLPGAVALSFIFKAQSFLELNPNSIY